VNQNSLLNSTVVIVGDGRLGEFLLFASSGLGIGTICYISKNIELVEKVYGDRNTYKRLLAEYGIKVEFYEDIDDIARIKIYSEKLAFIDVTNNPDSKAELAYRVLRWRDSLPETFIISASCDQREGAGYAVRLSEEYTKKIKNDVENMEEIFFCDEYAGLEQGWLAPVISGLVLEDVRKFFEDQLSPSFEREYNLPRFDFPKNLEEKILMIGAGGGGTYVGIAAASLLNEGKVTIVDPDFIKPHNLNRQVFAFDKVGKPKSEILANLIKILNPKLDVSYEIASIGVLPSKEQVEKGARMFDKNEILNLAEKYTVIADGVDNDLSFNFIVNLAKYFGKKYSIGRIQIYTKKKMWEGRTSYCKFTSQRKIDLKCCDKPLEERAVSCAAVPSLIIPHLIVGTLHGYLSVFSPSFKEIKYKNKDNSLTIYE